MKFIVDDAIHDFFMKTVESSATDSGNSAEILDEEGDDYNDLDWEIDQELPLNELNLDGAVM